MIKPEMVPKEVCLALKETLFSGPGHDIYATAITAALSAWPGMRKPMRVNGLQSEFWLELPLPQETRDADSK